MSVDRGWIDRCVVDGYITDEFMQGVEEFLSLAYGNSSIVYEGTIKCPCAACKHRKYLSRDEITVHLYKKGFVPNYKLWTVHGELCISEPSSSFSGTVRGDNPYKNMVLDVAGPKFVPDTERIIEPEEPNPEAARFYSILRDADESLWTGCTKHSKLSAASQFLNIKSECNMTEACYDRLISLVKSMLPKEEKLAENFYQTKKMMKLLGFGYDIIHACPNDCILYYGEEDKDRTRCSKCDHPRYEAKRAFGKNQKDIPYKVVHYFPLTPRLQRLYMSENTAKYMSWNKKENHASGFMSHPSDSEAWRHFDRLHPLFAEESRNIRLGLSTDGFSLFGHSAVNYTCWPVFVTPYNLPPWMCMKEPYIFLTLVIPGPRSPGMDLNIYLRPLIDELNSLWMNGTQTYDSFNIENFNMRAALLWTISDFQAYGMLSGWKYSWYNGMSLLYGACQIFSVKTW
ncbi:Transposon protein, putative, CACTA, En/Spm sub-class [Quillaja saponaria]|uniref:Transposon protein, putative, CACTA, En/Spm sub-class n=1 Tax=Quillaja saponaria TaxID=32244 RepID=A0AAD7KMI0_QUISA|nr:Transposon protein, putative, CACTA, En/Spm sub-class [Quillaja saponaria]